MKGDLISRQALLDIFSRNSVFEHITNADGKNVIEIINNTPAAYDVDKVVERLEQQRGQYFRRAEEIKNKFGESEESRRTFSKSCSYDHAIEIVKSGGMET